jgi:hypothetical protein
MPWINLGIFNISKNWKSTIPVAGEIFRIKHFFINNPKKEYLKAAIGQGFYNDGLNIFDTRRLTYREEVEIFNFSFPVGLESHSLFFKRLDDSPLNWSIKVETFSSTSIEQDFIDYLTQRFGDFMPIFSRQVIQPEYILQLSDQCGEKILNANETSKILEARIDRRTVEIHNPSNQVVTIGLQINQDNDITVEQVRLEPLDDYEFPNSGDGAMYVGDVFAHCSDFGSLIVVEKIAVKKTYSSENSNGSVTIEENKNDKENE